MSTSFEPIAKDSTMQSLIHEFEHRNSLLAIIAERSRSDLYSNMQAISTIIRSNSVEANKKVFPIGDQIIVPWKDMDDSSHNTDATAHQLPFRIVHHGMVTLQDDEQVPGMYLMLEPGSTAVSSLRIGEAHEAAFVFNTSTISNQYCKFTYNGTVYYFLPGVCSVGQLVVLPDYPANGSAVRIMRTDRVTLDTTVTLTTTQPSGYLEGIDFGTLRDNSFDMSVGNVNMGMRTFAANPNWSFSSRRLYLNTNGNIVWTPKGTFDTSPLYTGDNRLNGKTKGFMTGFGQDFLRALKPIKVSTPVRTEDDVSGYESTYDTFFLPSIQNMYGIAGEASQIAQDTAFDYWEQAMGTEDPVAKGTANQALQVFGSANYALRNPDVASYVHAVSSVRGTDSSFSAESSYPLLYMTPCCCVC